MLFSYVLGLGHLDSPSFLAAEREALEHILSLNGQQIAILNELHTPGSQMTTDEEKEA